MKTGYPPAGLPVLLRDPWTKIDWVSLVADDDARPLDAPEFLASGSTVAAELELSDMHIPIPSFVRRPE